MKPQVTNRRTSRTSGSAIVMILAVLAIMMILIAANSRTAWLLHQELRLIEHRQVSRWAVAPTNSPASLPDTNAPATRP